MLGVGRAALPPVRAGMKKASFTLLQLQAAALVLVLAAAAESRQSASLDGTWHIALDPNDTAVAEGWFARDIPLQLQAAFKPIAVPGTWGAQGFGTPWECDFVSYTKVGHFFGSN